MNTLDEILARFNKLPAEEQARTKQWLAKSDQVWFPNPGPQTQAYNCEADELLYGGEAGGGKTDLQIGLALTAHRRSLILRRHNKEVLPLADRVEAILHHRNGFNSQTKYWRLPGRVIRFGGCQHVKDREDYQGNPSDLICFDELANFSEDQYTFIIAWNRSTIPGQRVRVVSGSNPPVTPEGYWIIKRWGAWLDPNHPNPAVEGELRWYTTIDGVDTEVEGPGDVIVNGEVLVDHRGKPIRPLSRTFIRSGLGDNPDLEDSGYAARLEGLPEYLRPSLKEGDFAKSIRDDPWQVIPTHWINAAQLRWHEDGGRNAKMTCLGVDIAQGGDDQTVLSRRYGGWFAKLLAYRGMDTHDGPSVAALIFRERRDGAEVVIDMGGGHGGSTFDHIKQDFKPTKFIGAGATTGTRNREGLRFVNLRAEAIWRFRDALDPEYGSNIALPPDDELRADLGSYRFKVTPRGIQIEDKDKTKERIGRSPDKGDAVIMAWYGKGKTNPGLFGKLGASLPTRANLGYAFAKKGNHR